MKMKKLLAILLALLISASLCFSLASCGGGAEGGEGGTEGGGETGGETGGQTEALTLVEGGNPKFQFVFSKDISSSTRTLANSTIKAINKLMNKEAASEYETDENEKDIEIIIGTPSYRGTECAIDYHYLGPEGYAVKVVGTKVLVLFGSETKVGAALDHLKETVFGITSKTKKLETVVVSEDKLIEAPQSFTLTSTTVAGNDIKNYVFEYPTSVRSEAQAIQSQLYNKVGIWLPKGSSSATQKAVIIRVIDNGGEGTTPNGFRAYVDENENLVIETEFANKITDGLNAFFGENVLKSGQTEVAFENNYVYDKFDARNIYYEDKPFGAKGDGRTNDFEAIQACHEYANQYGHTVNAKAGKTYYIGKTGGESVTVQTDVNWNGCTFTFDDSLIKVCLDSSCGGSSRCEDCKNRNASIFVLKYDRSTVSVADALNAHIATHGGIFGGYGEADNTTKIDNWPLNYDALVHLATAERKIWVRKGLNADSGDEMGEVVLIHADGTIDSTTPFTWDYTSIAWADAYAADDKPITIDGGGAFINTIANEPTDSEYISFNRNISVKRSNVTITNLNHRLIETIPERAPYAGILYVNHASNVTFSNITLDMHKGRFGNNGAQQGSYEIGGYASHNLKYFNVNVIDFFTDGSPDDFVDGAGNLTTEGGINFRGMMGTNYCRNFHFKGCQLNSFDAHKGLGNLLIEDCTYNSILIMGSGDVVIRNTTVYADQSEHFMSMRADYGASYRGTLTLENCTMKIRNTCTYNTQSNNHLTILESSYDPNFDYDRILNPDYDKNDPNSVKYLEGEGTTNYLPEKIVVKDFKVVKYKMLEYVSCDKSETGRNYLIEEEVAFDSNTSVYLIDYQTTMSYRGVDISEFAFNGGYSMKNRYIGTKELIVETTGAAPLGFNLVIPNTLQFKNSTYVLNGQTMPWYTGT